jgi:hypothetical protein
MAVQGVSWSATQPTSSRTQTHLAHPHFRDEHTSHQSLLAVGGTCSGVLRGL